MPSHPDPASAPQTPQLSTYQSHKIVQAGEITNVIAGYGAGCYVIHADGLAHFRKAPEGMFARYTPKNGDFWVLYDNEYESISPREAFLAGYHIINPVDEINNATREGVRVVGMVEDSAELLNTFIHPGIGEKAP